MSIKNIFNHGLALAVAAGTSCFFLACSDDSSASSTEGEYGYIPSSASISDRGDIDYKDTVILNKKVDLNIELIKSDTTSQDSSEIYVDSLATTIPLYLGELTCGSRIRVKASVSNITEDKIRIRSEHGDNLKALTAVAKNSLRTDSIFSNYLSPSLGTIPDSTYRDSNQFVVFTPNHYYLEISGEFTDESTARLFVQIDTNYYNYTGDTSMVSMSMNDTLRGIIPMGDDDVPETIKVDFSASEGYSLNLTTSGTNISKFALLEGDSLLGETAEVLDTMLIPSDSLNWTLKISPETFSYYSSGPFAFFSTITRSRELEKGEYFANPDSIKYPGEQHLATRPKDLPEEAIYRYNLRQEQYVWLGDYKEGDSLIINHDILNYSNDNFKSPVTYEILNKNKEVLGSISNTYGGEFKVPADGPYYLHYLRINSEPKDRVSDSLRYVLQLKTMVQQPGLLKEMKFYDEKYDDIISTLNVSVGDTIRFNRFSFSFTAIESSSWKEIGSDVDWFIPCSSIDYINREKIYSCSSKDTEQSISSDYLIAQEAGIGMPAEIIAQSKADPSMRATLKVSIIKAAED